MVGAKTCSNVRACLRFIACLADGYYGYNFAIFFAVGRSMAKNVPHFAEEQLS
jgi:hypothetical protein